MDKKKENGRKNENENTNSSRKRAGNSSFRTKRVMSFWGGGVLRSGVKAREETTSLVLKYLRFGRERS